ncbi:MAG: DUF4245 domain-containing protein, partial [Micrococcaceae bacterium]|nr:DUF4245 domain-containing protein [Micrococcaceae bacterium]
TDPNAPAPRPVLTAKQAQRARQPWIGMVLSVVALLALVAVVLILNPEPPQRPREDRVDVAAAAATVPHDDGVLPALAPEVPESWYANFARLQTMDGVSTWDVGWVVTDTVFAGMQQAHDVDPTWVTLRVDSVPATETLEIDGLAWDLHADPRAPEKRLVTEVEDTTVVLTTTGDRAVLEDLARGVAKETR